MEKHTQERYEKPEVKDFGTLQELTAICNTAGSGDSAYKDASHSTYYESSTGVCQSS